MPAPTHAPRLKLSLEILEVLRNIGISVTAGAVIAMLCFIGKGFVNSVFGKLFSLIFHKLSAFTLLHIGMGPLTILGVIFGFTVLTALWTNTLTSSVPSQEDNFLYGLVCWAFPIGAFTLSLSTGIFGLSSACWLAFGLGTLTNSCFLVVPSAMRGFTLWKAEREALAQQQPVSSQQNDSSGPSARAQQQAVPSERSSVFNTFFSYLPRWYNSQPQSSAVSAQQTVQENNNSVPDVSSQGRPRPP